MTREELIGALEGIEPNDSDDDDEPVMMVQFRRPGQCDLYLHIEKVVVNNLGDTYIVAY